MTNTQKVLVVGAIAGLAIVLALAQREHDGPDPAVAMGHAGQGSEIVAFPNQAKLKKASGQ